MFYTKEIIEACIDYIEKNIHNKITLDDISRYTGVSKYYLHRMFKALTGESIMDYAQSRKLSASIEDLVNSNMRIIDIAMNYGFDYEQSYIRAFKKKFGYTPLKIRNEQLSVILTEKINTRDLMSVDNTVTYKPFFVFKQKFYLVGMKHKILSRSGDNAANIAGCDFFYNHRHKIKNAVNPNVYYGYTEWSGWPDGYIYYIPSLQVTDLSQVPEGMVGITVPANKYVVFRFIGFFRPDEIRGRNLGRILVHMYRKWLNNSNFTLADTFRLEYIDTTLCKDNYCELDILQPISNQYQISTDKPAAY